jgi:TonB family protein
VPDELTIVSSPDDDLSASALQAVRQWRYRPTLLNGNPVEVTTTIVVNYTLAR